MLLSQIHATVPPTGTGTGTGTSGTTGTGTTSGTGTTGTTGTTGSKPTAGVAGATLGGTDFLTLMLAQLKNQDPTSPVDSNTFLQQLASLSEVQGITALNTSFSTLSSSLTSSQALQASSLLGHQALVASTTVATTGKGAIYGGVSVPQTTADVKLNISDASGALVRTIDLGAQAAGMTGYQWDGLTNAGATAPAGTYTLSATYAGAASGGTAATTYVNGTVESVSLGSGASGMTLNVAGVGSVAFSNVQQISN